MSLSGRHIDGPTEEHLIPVSRGGSPNDLRNLGVSHRRCNLARGNKLISEWRNEKPYISKEWNWLS